MKKQNKFEKEWNRRKMLGICVLCGEKEVERIGDRFCLECRKEVIGVKVSVKVSVIYGD